MKFYDEELLKADTAANNGRKYQQCKISVMDTIADPDITFDNKGISNYYYEYLIKEKQEVLKGAEGEKKLAEIVQLIKESGKGNKYDCITGVSGGVDSTYLAYMAKKLGLRPLIVHFDNGWNSELAVKNIENIISRLGFDLYTLVVDWEEFKDIQLAYLKASVIDIEAITDHAIIGTLYKLAAENNIKYILSGANVTTENTLPKSWIFNKIDHINIKDIHDHYGTIKLKTYPLFNSTKKRLYTKLKKITSVYLLNYLPYNKKDVKNIITTELSWKDYGGKHYESVFTRFYQGYILPVKFGVDKRKAHLSDLIFAGQISKAEAMEELKKPIYDSAQFSEDYEFVLKKFNLTEKEFEEIMNNPRKEHSEFKVEDSFWNKYPWLKPLKFISSLTR
ncbi:MAG: N-acetyl sugar amidotransferase [Chitinophagaceae bacterium]|nr:N-acetyl sugar amidotransferase [Chitinophagaceae bacterium]